MDKSLEGQGLQEDFTPELPVPKSDPFIMTLSVNHRRIGFVGANFYNVAMNVENVRDALLFVEFQWRGKTYIKKRDRGVYLTPVPQVEHQVTFLNWFQADSWRMENGYLISGTYNQALSISNRPIQNYLLYVWSPSPFTKLEVEKVPFGL